MYDPCIVVVAEKADPLARAVVADLPDRGDRVLYVAPADLGSFPVMFGKGIFFARGCVVCGILFRASYDNAFTVDFAEEDQHFSAAEFGALWLTALNCESVLAINRYDAEAWFEGYGWTVWRRRLIKEGIPVSPFSFGEDCTGGPRFWLPYTNTLIRPAPGGMSRRTLGTALTGSKVKQTSLVVCGRVIAGERYPCVVDTMDMLRDEGVRIAEIATDSEERVLFLNTRPAFTDTGLTDQAATLIVEMFHAHLHLR